MYDLKNLGWNDHFQNQHERNTRLDQRQGAQPPLAARVIAEHRGGRYELLTEAGALHGVAPGRWRHHKPDREQWPAVGDWVEVDPPEQGDEVLLRRVLSRQSSLMRRASGERTEAQVLGANLDLVFVVVAVGADFSPRRVERYLTTIWESGARPAVILSKVDLVEDHWPLVARLEAVAGGVPVLPVSGVSPGGLSPLRRHLGPGQTVALVGSSGVGKSTITNSLLGEEVQAVKTIRESDETGRHTTTGRHLFVLPNDQGLLMDTPGMRELQLWDGQEALDQTFKDVEELAQRCRFTNCTHDTEPGCAIHAAVERGELTWGRVHSYQKLQREAAYQERRRNDAAARLERKKWKKLSKHMRRFDNGKR